MELWEKLAGVLDDQNDQGVHNEYSPLGRGHESGRSSFHAAESAHFEPAGRSTFGNRVKGILSTIVRFISAFH